MLGSGINPESFKQDYSGFTRAAEMQAQGIASLGQNISGAIEDYGKMKKQQQEDERAVQKSKNVAKAIGDLIPDLKPTIQNSLTILDNKELPLSQRKAEAEAISDILNLGIGEIRNRQDIGFKERALKIQEDEVAARNAPQPPSFDFKEVSVPHSVNGVKGTIRMLEDANSGRVRTSDGKEYSNIEDAKAGRNPIGQGDNGIDAALNLPIPALTGNLNRDAIAINNAQQLPSTSELDNTPAIILTGGMPDGQDNLANVTPVVTGTPTVTKEPTIDGPPGFVPDEVPAVEPETTARIITGEEASALNLSPENTYEVKMKNGKAVGYTVIDKSAAPMNEADKVKLDESSLRSAAEAVYAIDTINELTSSKGFSDVFGAGYGLKYIFGTEAYDAEAARGTIVSLATTDSMRKFQGLGSMSDAEFAVAQEAATQIKKAGISDKKAARELNRLRNYFAESIRRAEDLGRIPKGSYQKMLTGQTGNQNNPSTEAPMSATDRFRAKVKPLPLR
jgi:hypothetical protein